MPLQAAPTIAMLLPLHKGEKTICPPSALLHARGPMENGIIDLSYLYLASPSQTFPLFSLS
jgi:hypothetical protein